MNNKIFNYKIKYYYNIINFFFLKFHCIYNLILSLVLFYLNYLVLRYTNFWSFNLIFFINLNKFNIFFFQNFIFLSLNNFFFLKNILI